MRCHPFLYFLVVAIFFAGCSDPTGSKRTADVTETEVPADEEEETDSETDWDIHWAERDWVYEVFDTTHLDSWQRINHFPGMTNVARKARLALNLEKMRRAFPRDYGFYPRTWVLPADLADFRTQFNGRGRSTNGGVFLIKVSYAHSLSSQHCSLHCSKRSYLLSGGTLKQLFINQSRRLRRKTSGLRITSSREFVGQPLHKARPSVTFISVVPRFAAGLAAGGHGRDDRSRPGGFVLPENRAGHRGKSVRRLDLSGTGQ